ncbi:MAG: type II secretion system F family protein [Nitrospirae bacterium]|nr:type II secretion system F family protein [Nitrospirota bacterium]
MPTVFRWTGRTAKGTIQKGEFTANSKEEVTAYLRRQSIIPTDISPKPKALFKLAPGGKVTDKDIVVFTRQFATMIDAGLPLVQALDILSKQTGNKTLAKTLGEVKADVEGGSTYADALRKHPRIFSELYANMIAAGETGGILDTILGKLATYIEKSMKLKKRVKGAMMYPSFVIFAAVGVVAVIMVFVVPTFAKMFTQMGGILPLPTRIVIGISHFLGGIGGAIMLAGIIAFSVFIVQFRRTATGKKTIDTLLLKVPIIGVLLQKVAIAKFTSTLGTLVASGVPILEGLDITARTAGNVVVEKSVLEVKQAVSEGKTLAEPLSKLKIFPPMVTQMIAVGESTGAVETMLSKIAEFYDEEVDTAVASLTSLLEPMLIVFLGTTVGFIVVAMYLPIFKLITLVK